MGIQADSFQLDIFLPALSAEPALTATTMMHGLSWFVPWLSMTFRLPKPRLHLQWLDSFPKLSDWPPTQLGRQPASYSLSHTGNYDKLTGHLNPVKILNLQKYLQLANCYIVSGFGGLWVLLRPAIGRNRRPKGALSKWPLWVVGASARGDWQTIGAINRRHKKCTVIGCHIMSASA